MLKCYHTIINLVLGLLCLFCVPGCFFPSLTHLRVWLAPSPCPSLRTYTISMTAASGNFSRQLPASDSRAQGTLPPSASGGPPVLSLTPHSLLRQPPPPTLPPVPMLRSAPPASSSQPSPSLTGSRGRSWHSQRAWQPLGISDAPGRMHLPHLLPCFCNNMVLTCLQIYLPGSLPLGRKAGGSHGSMKGLTWCCREGERTQIPVAHSQPCKTLLLQALAPLHPITQTHRPWVLKGWALLTGKWDNLLLTLSIPQPNNNKGAGVMHLLDHELQARRKTLLSLLCPTASPPAFCILHLCNTCFTAPFQRIKFMSSIASETE